MRAHPPGETVAPFRPAAALLVALAAALAAGPAPLPAQQARYTRGIAVPAEGWVRVPLDPAILRRAAPTGGHLRLFGPDGGEVEFRRVVSDDGGRRLEIEVMPAEAEGGAGAVLDVGPVGRRHDRLLLGPEGGDPVGIVLLEGSDDLEVWELLAVAEPLPVEEVGGLLALDYPGTGRRYLRLTPLPESATLPALSSASVELVPERGLVVELAAPTCRSDDRAGAGPGTACRLAIGAFGQRLRRLDLTVAVGEPGRPVGYRLLAPEDGRWEVVAEGVWRTPREEVRHSLALDLEVPSPAEPLRLELYAEEDVEAPTVASPAAELAPEDLLFQARRVGRHTLAYGPGVYSSSGSADVRPPAGASFRVIPPGLEETGETPAEPPPLPGAAGPAPAVRFEESWRVRHQGAGEGGLHGLVLPPEAYGTARPGLEDLRLVAGEVQVPYLRWRPEEPARVALAGGDRAAVETPEPGAERLLLELEHPGLPVSALVLHAPPGQPARRVRVLAAGLRRAPGGEVRQGPEIPVSPWLDWPCQPRPPLSCRLSVSLEEAERGVRAGSQIRRLLVETEGVARADAPGLEVWRRQDVLVFPWPSGDRALRLLAGAGDLEAPDWELERRRQELLARPWSAATLVPEDGPEGDGGAVGRWTVGLTLLGALTLLLVLLHRILDAREPDLGAG